MRRTTIAKIFCLILGALLVPGIRAAEKPNLILLLTDDQRWDALGAAGNDQIETPELDRLAREGVRFTNAFVTTSICATSRASIMLGQYARRHGIWDFQTGLSSGQLEASFPGLLREAGYHTGFIGKWGVGTPPQNFFDFDRSFPGQGRYFEERQGEGRHLTESLGDQIEEFLSSRPSGVPFCLLVSFKAPHVQDSYDLSEFPFPFDPKLSDLYAETRIRPAAASAPAHFLALPEFLKNSENRMRWAVRFWGPARYQESVKGYYRLVSGVDRVVGRLNQALRLQQLSDQTVIVFTSDNGFLLGEYGLAGKWLAYDASIRVPLIIKGEAVLEARRAATRSEMVLSIDIAPTLLELAGLTVPDSMQGVSLLPLLRREDSAADWRENFLYEHLFEHPRIPRAEALRSRRWKYVRYLDQVPVREQLFDLAEDPLEVRDLMLRGQAVEQRDKMKALLDKTVESAR